MRQLMKIPNIFNFSDCKSYFHNFYVINKQLDSTFTYRILAQKLNWPISYLNDVINDRKPLTIQRAMSFIKYFDLDSLDAERLIYLSLKDSNDGDVKDFFEMKLNEKNKIETPSYIPHSDADIEIELSDKFIAADGLKYDLVTSAVLKILVWANGKILFKNISKLLYSFPELANDDFLRERLYELEEKNIIKIKGLDKDSLVEVEILHSSIDFLLSYATIHLFKHFYDNTNRIIINKKVAGNFNCGLVNIHRKYYKEVRTRFSALAAWLLSIESANDGEDYLPNDYMLFQYNIHITSLIDFKVLGIDNLLEWEK